MFDNNGQDSNGPHQVQITQIERCPSRLRTPDAIFHFACRAHRFLISRHFKASGLAAKSAVRRSSFRVLGRTRAKLSKFRQNSRAKSKCLGARRIRSCLFSKSRAPCLFSIRTPAVRHLSRAHARAGKLAPTAFRTAVRTLDMASLLDLLSASCSPKIACHLRCRPTPVSAHFPRLDPS